MSAPEKSTSKIFVGVATGLIVTMLLYVGRHWLPPVLAWLRDVIRSVLRWLFTAHAQLGVFIILFWIGVIWLFIAFLCKRSPNSHEPQWRDFTEFEFLGVLWRWSYDGRGRVYDLASFCPQHGCDMQVYGRLGHYYGPGTETTLYKCDRCGYEPEVKGTNEAIEDKVTREIQRLLRGEGWKDHVSPAVTGTAR